MDKTDITEEMEKRPQEIMRWFSPKTQKILDVCVRLQEDFGNPRQPATDYSQYQDHYSYTILRYGKDYDAQRALRIRKIHAFFHRHKITENTRYELAQRALRISAILTYLNRYQITVAGCLEMPLEVLEERLLEITNYHDTPWYYRFIPCCVNIQRQNVIKPKTTKRSNGGLFGRIRKVFSRRSQKFNED
ncbi:uncharacterized protein LOC128162169 [Crassostrea angulata]|uniref:uncharacterized protein LOC128162169 n=1 Tax=Magallana angulata TaxID=2784310 RepID=UPI0022B106CF|nr:uncharacterized protein LOC128162169 [Crassostrea angulata]